MFGLIIIIIASTIAIFGVIGAIVSKPGSYGNNEGRLAGIGIALTAGAIAVLMLAFTTTVIVPARTVGVAVAFGKPVSVLENGFHLKAPWTKVEKFDLAIQNSTYNGDNSIEARLANSAKARVDASIQWQLKPNGMMETFMDYREMDAIRAQLVDRNFRAALNEVMANHDPLANLNEDGEPSANLAALAADVKEIMEETLSEQIEVRSVTIPIINYDEATQGRIDQLQTEMANTRIAQQQKRTNTEISEGNKILEGSLTNQILTDKCIDAVEKSGASPLGCFPGAAAVPTVTN